MNFISDIMLGAGALGAAIYCFVLARRLRRFTDLEKGIGGAVAVLAVQVDDLTKTLRLAQNAADGAETRLAEQGKRAEAAAVRLELLLSAMHELPDPVQQVAAPISPFYHHNATQGPIV